MQHLNQKYIIPMLWIRIPNTDFYLMRIRMWVQVTKMMRIHADPDEDPDPQHCIVR